MTTLEYNRTEKSFAAWGLALEGAILTRNNCRPDTYTVTHPHASAADPDLFPYEARVIIRRGGTIAFVGYCISATLSAAPEGVLTTYTFANAWWLLERTPFQQRTASKTVESFSFPYQSQVILFARLDQNDYFEKIDSGTQIAEALNHCRDACLALGWSAPYQLGTIDPALDLPTWTTQEISCAAVIQKALELSPDCTVDWDYTTSPPTVSVRARANRTAVTLALAPGQLTEAKLERLMKRYAGEPYLDVVATPEGRPGPMVLTTLDFPEAERADVLRSLATYAKDPACAKRLAALYRKLPKRLRVLEGVPGTP